MPKIRTIAEAKATYRALVVFYEVTREYELHLAILRWLRIIHKAEKSLQPR